jgi:hypothetical protein
MKARRLFLVLMIILLTSIAGVVTARLSLRRISGLTSIDPPPEVAAELARLQAMPAGCELEYGRVHVRRSQADIHQTVWIQACGERWMSERIAVPQVGEHLHFRLSRDSATEAWSVEVDTERAPRSELIEAIRTFTPKILEVGPGLLVAGAARRAKADAEYEAQQRAAAEGKAKNASSYK